MIKLNKQITFVFIKFIFKFLDFYCFYYFSLITCTKISKKISNSMEFFVKTNTLLLPNDHILCTSNMFFDGSEDGNSKENVGINSCT